MEKIYLLDAYALIYRSYYALIRNPRITSYGLNTSAIFGFVNTLEEILTKEHPDFIAVAFDPAGPTFRHEAYPDYKAQREATPEDIRKAVPYIKQIIEAYNIPIFEIAGYEADDIIGTLARKAEAAGMQTYMVTPDKDYGQLVTKHTYQWRPETGGHSLLREEDILDKYGIERTSQVIDLLGLMGDTADNIPGCPGVGEKTAKTLIEKYGTIEDIYNHTDELKGKLKERLIDNKQQVMFSKYLVTIKTDVPLNFDPQQLKRQESNLEALKATFGKLEFNSFIKKICNSQDTHEAPPVQRDLFSSNADETHEESFRAIFKAVKFDISNYKAIDNQEETNKIIAKICAEKNFAFSIETTSLSGISAEICGIGIALSANEAYYMPIHDDLRSPATIQQLKNIFENDEIGKIGNNLKFSQLVLMSYDIHLKGPLFDTAIAHYLIQPELKHNPDYLAEIYLHHTGISLEQYFGSHWREERDMRLLPDDLRKDFTCEQADMALRLKPILTDELKRLDETPLFENIEMPLSGVLAEMEHNGVVIDLDKLHETSRQFTRRMQDYEHEVYRLSGHEDKPFNLSSPRQVGDVLFGELHLLEKPKKTKSGQYVTSEAVLEELRADSPVVDSLLKYRGIKKLLSTYVTALPALVNSRTGHIHTSFNQTVTATGRLSSSNPNLQNIPVRGEDGKDIRRVFIPEPGCEFLSADYSQIELRVMAHLSSDPHMIDAFRQGHDIHAATAARIYHKSIADVTADERRKAKTANFGIIYGITVFGLAQRIGISRTEAKELIDNYFNTFPGIRDFMDACIAKARQRGYAETIFHRRRYLPDISSRNAVVRGYAERNAINAPIQGSAADIIKAAMVSISQRFHKEQLQSKMILQVHDELDFSVLPEEKERVALIVKTEMEQAYAMQVPLVAELGWGSNWLEAH